MLVLNYPKKSDNKHKKKDYLNKFFSHYFPLIILIIIISIITYYRVLIQIDIGPLSDSCDFLSNALVFAGHGFGYYDWTRPPFFPFIISLFFRLGFVSTSTIFIVDGLTFILGVIGFYLFLKLRFNNIESFLGGLLFATFPTVLTVLGTGFSDLTSVTLTIWALYFLVLAVKKNSKFFILVFPLVMMAFLARYNTALIIFPITIYILINKDKIRNFKNILIGILGSILVVVPVFIFFYEQFGNIIYPFIATFGTTIISSSPSLEYYYNPNLLYFIDRFPIHVGFEGILILFIILAGFFIYFLIELKRTSIDKKKLLDELSVKKTSSKIKLLIFFVLTLIFIGTFGQINYIITELVFFVLIFLFYNLTKSFKIQDMDTYIFVFAWYMVFFIFSSIYVIKTDRYFVLMAPAISYFLILGLSEISNRLPFKFKKKNLTFTILTLILTLMILLSTAAFLPVIKEVNNNNKISNEQVTLISEWFITYDPNYKNKIIYSDLWPYFAWSLKTNVKMMPIFKNNQIYSGGIKNSTFSPQDSIAFNNFLVNNNADYYFCVQQINLTSYKPIKQFGNLIIYKKI
ncbi:MAG: glycosyltransferase family 39 protein [Methanobacterium sp.]